MCQLNCLRNVLLAMTFLITPAIQAAPQLGNTILSPYVLYYEGVIEGDASVIAKSIDGFFSDVDHSKVNYEIFKQNVPGSNIYTIEASIEPKSDQMVEYVQGFVSTHGEFTVGSVRLQLRPATQVAEFFSISGFGPDKDGKKEVKWGTFARVRQFSNVSEYTSNIYNLGASLGQGKESDIRKTIPLAINPTDAYIFLSWMNGVGPSKAHLSRFTCESHSFFVMKDGTYVQRFIAYNIDRILNAQFQSEGVASQLVEHGFQSVLGQAQ